LTGRTTVDSQVIDALASVQLQQVDAYRLSREIIRRASPLVWQCRACGRLFIDDIEGTLQSYLPATEDTPRESAINE
jgi:hypothetical protein